MYIMESNKHIKQGVPDKEFVNWEMGCIDSWLSGLIISLLKYSFGTTSFSTTN